MADEPKKHPSGLSYYNAAKAAASQPADADGGFWSGVRSRVNQWITGADQFVAPPAPTKLPHEVYDALNTAPSENGIRKYVSNGVTFYVGGNTPKQDLDMARAQGHGVPQLVQEAAKPAPATAEPVARPEAVEVVQAHTYYAIQRDETLGGIVKKQTALREASGLEGDSSVWAVALATAKLNGMKTINETIRAGNTLQLPSAEDVRTMVKVLSAGIAADGKITWSEAKDVNVQQIAASAATKVEIHR